MSVPLNAGSVSPYCLVAAFGVTDAGFGVMVKLAVL